MHEKVIRVIVNLIKVDTMEDESQIHGESNTPLYLAISIMFNIAMVFIVFVMPVIFKGAVS